MRNIVSCPGIGFSRNCSVNSLQHIWKVGGNNEKIISTGSQSVQVEGGVTYRLVAVFISSLKIVTNISGTVTADLNNTVISCRDGFREPGEGHQQQISVRVYGTSTVEATTLMWTH